MSKAHQLSSGYISQLSAGCRCLSSKRVLELSDVAQSRHISTSMRGPAPLGAEELSSHQIRLEYQRTGLEATRYSLPLQMKQIGAPSRSTTTPERVSICTV